MIKLTLRELAARKRRLFGSFFAVLLGVAFLSGTLVLGDTLENGISSLLGRAYEQTDVSVRNAANVTDQPGMRRGNIDARIVATVKTVDGVAAAEPVIQGSGQILDKEGKALPVQGPRNAGNWITDPTLNPWRIAEGRAPSAAGEVLIDRKAAKDGDLEVGDQAAVLTPERIPVTIVGIVTFGDADTLGGSSFTAFSLDESRRVLAQGRDQVTSVAVKAKDGVSETVLADRIQKVLPSGVEAITGTQLTDENVDTVGQFLSIVRTFLGVFAAVALLVAAFSIHNTFAILVAQRTREAALLRAIGASRRQILVSVVIEALVLGIAGAVAGAISGYGLAALLKELFVTMGFGPPSMDLSFSLSPLLIGVPVGIVVTLVACLVPAFKATRVAPIAALRETEAEQPGTSRSRLISGAVMGVIGAALLAWAMTAEDMMIAGIGAALALIAMVVLGPIAARPAAAVIGAPAARFRGAPGKLARENALRSPRRTAGAATSLMIGVGVVTLFTVFAASFTKTIEQDAKASFTGDLIVETGGFGQSGFSPRLESDVAALPQVAKTAGVGNGQARIDGEIRSVEIAEPDRLAGIMTLKPVSGAFGQGLAVSEDAAKQVGDQVTLQYPDGATQQFQVTTVYQPMPDFADYIVPQQDWLTHDPQALDSRVYVRLREGTPTADGEKAVVAAAAAHGAPDVQTLDEFVDTQTEPLRNLLSIIYVMLGLAIIIALMGIANTLSLAIHERIRELGLLRAVGATQSQVRTMVRWEAVTVALFGTAGGVALGTVLAWALSASAGSAFAVPLVQVVAIVVVGALAGALAAIRPARRAAKLRLISAITTA